ncbi:hypothetical protein [Prevotella sp. AGR2160]|uniref:hypothetical protein n=1 Tax=Prevotella sp. AGR2160 TaxID=1280674 RepID=UPI0006878A9D|nr:hypothetical protein [Prevotella sp. AGR2160]
MIKVSGPHGKYRTERLLIHGLKCGYCQGNGWFWKDDGFGGSVKDPCPLCKGSGSVDAAVAITYGTPEELRK